MEGEYDDIDAAMREVRAYLEVNDPESLVFLAREGNHTETITAGEGYLGELHHLEMIVAHLEELARQQGLDIEEAAKTAIETATESPTQFEMEDAGGAFDYQG